MKRYYFENMILCGYCNGSGLRDYMDYCRCCNGTGIESLSEYLGRHAKSDILTLTMGFFQAKKTLDSRRIEREYNETRIEAFHQQLP